MSEYNAPHKCILEIQKSSLMKNARDVQKKVIEKLYINKDIVIKDKMEVESDSDNLIFSFFS